jgi:hypothetical protein
MNGLAGSGALSGRSIGAIANAYPTYFLPASYVFGIWSLIYLGLLAYVAYQLRPAWQDGDAASRIGSGWLANAALNTAWLSAFSFERFITAWLLMVALLANLIWIHERVGTGTRPLPHRDRALVAGPFNVYLAWISVALIANTFQLVAVVGWDGFGIPGVAWACAMLVVAGLLAATMARRRASWAFPLVFAWAFVGIAARYPDVAPLRNVAWVTAVAGVGYRSLLAVRARGASDWPEAGRSS